MTNDGTVVILYNSMRDWLINNGFKLLKEKQDLKDRTRKIYIFENTEELKCCMRRYMKPMTSNNIKLKI